MSPLARLISKLLMPLLYLNLAGMAAGAAWLGFLSQWQVIGIGFFTLMFSPFALPILMVPAGIFSHFMSLYNQAGRRGHERAMFFCSISYILLIISLIAIGLFYFVVTRVPSTALPAALLWGASAAMVPFLLWSSRDRSNVFIMTIVESAQVAMAFLIVACFAGLITGFWGAIALFMAVMAAITSFCLMYEEKLKK